MRKRRFWICLVVVGVLGLQGPVFASLTTAPMPAQDVPAEAADPPCHGMTDAAPADMARDASCCMDDLCDCTAACTAGPALPMSQRASIPAIRDVAVVAAPDGTVISPHRLELLRPPIALSA